VVRNAHASFRVVVTAPPGTLYFLAVQTNPVGIFRINLYRRPLQSSDPLVEERNIGFLAGVTPPGGPPLSETETIYLLDLWTPAGTRQPTVRVEALAKTAYWIVAPMEVRILPVDVPSIPLCIGPRERTELPLETVLGALVGHPPRCSPALTTFDSVMGRDTAEDAALAAALPPESRAAVFREIFPLFVRRRWEYIAPDPGESYLRIRQLIHREAERWTTGRAIRGTPMPSPDSR
jgi:hypothetical protein